MSGQLVGFCACWLCKQVFMFNPDSVPSVLIDPVTGRPPDLGGDPARAQREPLCPTCVETVNPLREARGLPPFTEGPE